MEDRNVIKEDSPIVGESSLSLEDKTQLQSRTASGQVTLLDGYEGVNGFQSVVTSEKRATASWHAILSISINQVTKLHLLLDSTTRSVGVNSKCMHTDADITVATTKAVTCNRQRCISSLAAKQGRFPCFSNGFNSPTTL